MFIFLLTPFDTRDYYYFKSNLSLLLLTKVFLTKNTCNVVLQSSKHEEITLPEEFMVAFILYFIGAILSKKYCQKWRAQK